MRGVSWHVKIKKVLYTKINKFYAKKYVPTQTKKCIYKESRVDFYSFVKTFYKELRNIHLLFQTQIFQAENPASKEVAISVQLILEWIASGATIQDIASKYTHLSTEAIQQAILYASDAMKNEIIIEVQHSNAA